MDGGLGWRLALALRMHLSVGFTGRRDCQAPQKVIRSRPSRALRFIEGTAELLRLLEYEYESLLQHLVEKAMGHFRADHRRHCDGLCRRLPLELFCQGTAISLSLGLPTNAPLHAPWTWRWCAHRKRFQIPMKAKVDGRLPSPFEKVSENPR
jgi:hypothetical protein